MPTADNRRPQISGVSHIATGRGPRRYIWHAPEGHTLDDILTPAYFRGLHPIAGQGDRIEVMLLDDDHLIFAELAVVLVTTRREPPKVHVALLNQKRIRVPDVVDASPAELQTAAELAAAGGRDAA